MHKNSYTEIEFKKELLETKKLPSKNALCVVLTAEQTITSRGAAVWKTWLIYWDELIIH